jgi:hypothetical protein
MDVPSTPVQPTFQARGGSIFTVFRGAALLLAIIALFFWGGATSVNDTAAENGGLLFLMVSAGIVAFAFIAGRKVRLFANQELVGSVGPFGGVRVCARTDLTEIRTICTGIRAEAWAPGSSQPSTSEGEIPRTRSSRWPSFTTVRISSLLARISGCQSSWIGRRHRRLPE